MSDDKPLLELEHQTEGTKFLRERNAAGLFDEQGLGKTKQMIDAVTQQVAAQTIDGTLVICPNILKSTWAEEIERHSKSRYAVFGSGKKARRDAFRSLRAVFYVINYEAVAAELVSLRALLRFKRIALVLDESHRIKSPSAKVTKAVHSLRADAAKRYILTGTPVANKPEDIWSQLFFLDDGATFGKSFSSFKACFCTPRGGYRNLEDFRQLLATMSLRREKEGTVMLPPKTVTRVPVVLQGRQSQMYQAMRNELAVWVETLTGEEVNRQGEHILSRLVRLAQIASNPALIDASYFEEPAKFAALDSILAGYLADSSRKVIVWTSFVGNIRSLADRFGRYRPVTLHGQMDSESRDAAVHDFKTDPTVRLLLANPAAAREGLTLTQANVAIYLDRTFNLVDFLQSQDRIHRLSQDKACEIVLLLAENSIDEFVDFSLAQKHRLAKYAQSDSAVISQEDLQLTKPDLLRALLAPEGSAG